MILQAFKCQQYCYHKLLAKRKIAMFIDISKLAIAFDFVNHDILLNKLKVMYGIDGTLIKFLTSYLQNRYQRVVVSNQSSTTLQVNSGVPQGSILGPLLFVLFINDISSGLSDGTNIVLYADDTKIWRRIVSAQDNTILQADINYLNDWAIKNMMKFHPSKCKILSISLGQPVPSPHVYILDALPLNYVESEKDLGVYMTPKLNWNMQCDRIYSDACQKFGVVRRNSHIVTDQKRRRALYLSLVRSIFENCSIIWRPTTISMSDKLEGLQKRAIKWILSEEEFSYSVELYITKCKQVDILPLNLKFDLNDLIFFHKVFYNLVPVTLPDYLKLYQGGSRLRQSHLDSLSLISSIIPRSSQNPLSRSFFYRTHLLWNKLPLDIRQLVPPNSFKSSLIKHLWKSVTVAELDSSFSSTTSDSP